MPELPEVETTVRGLVSVLKGRRIASAETRRASRVWRLSGSRLPPREKLDARDSINVQAAVARVTSVHGVSAKLLKCKGLNFLADQPMSSGACIRGIQYPVYLVTTYPPPSPRVRGGASSGRARAA